jgi:hypothetical protein
MGRQTNDRSVEEQGLGQNKFTRYTHEMLDSRSNEKPHPNASSNRAATRPLAWTAARACEAVRVLSKGRPWPVPWRLRSRFTAHARSYSARSICSCGVGCCFLTAQRPTATNACPTRVGQLSDVEYVPNRCTRTWAATASTKSLPVPV